MRNRAQTEFQRLWEQTCDRIRAYMFCACSNSNDTDDLAQECYLRALRNWDLFGGRGSRQAWLFAIARNTQIDWLRRKKRQAAALDDERIARPDPATSDASDAELIWEIVDARYKKKNKC